MRDHLAKYGVYVELSKGIIGITQNEHSVTATLAVYKGGQDTGQHEQVVCQYLVGADGAKGLYSCQDSSVIRHPDVFSRLDKEVVGSNLYRRDSRCRRSGLGRRSY